MSNVKSKKKKKRSQAPVALVYFVTVLIFLAIFAVVAVYLLKSFGIIGKEDEPEPEATAVSFTNLYARVNSKGVLADLTAVKIDTDDGKIYVIPMSPFTQSKSQPSKNFREVFEDGGMVNLRDTVEETFELEIDNYMSVSNAAFERVADIFGGITYTAKEELYYLSQDNDINDIFISEGELVSLTGRQIRLLCSYPVFSAGKIGNTEFLGEALAQIINNAFAQSSLTIDNMDNIYNIITSNSDTDFGTDDHRIQKAYIKEMINSQKGEAQSICPQGEWVDEKHFKLSDEYKAKLSETINSSSQEEESSQQDE